MKRLAILVSFVCASVGAYANLILNGGFEQYVHPLNSYTLVNAGNIATYIPNWHYVGPSTHNIALLGANYLGQPTQEVDVSGGSDIVPSGLYQSVATTAGQTYSLTFQVFTGEAYGHSGGVNLSVFDGTPTNLNDGTLTGVGATLVSATNLKGNNALGAAGLKTYTYTFVASSSSTTINFMMTTSGQRVSQIDNVVLESVPEPVTMALMAGSALVGYGRLRKRKLASPSLA